jgi:hypothetical protein
MNMAKVFFITLLSFAPFVLTDTLKIGDLMPDISGETLAGGNVTRPKLCPAKSRW